MKRSKLLMIAIVMMTLLTGCSQKQEEKEETTVVAKATPEEIRGLYTDEVAGRAMIEVSDLKISGSWSSSYNQIALFDLPTDYDASSNTIRYSDGVLTQRVYSSESDYADTEEYNDGTGYFEIKEKKLIWHDDKQNKDTVLVKVEPALYKRCDSLEEAVNISGIRFDEPADDLYPIEIKNKAYFAGEGLIMIMCENETQTINTGKASSMETISKVFDTSSFSKNWTEYVKGVEVNCFGNSEKIRMATFNNGTEYYGISYFDASAADEDIGMSIDDVQSLIMGMQ